MKSVNKIVGGRKIAVGSIQVQELLPMADGFLDPFLVLHHGVAKADENIPLHLQGVGPHPHRGFSAISFIYKGGVHHRDSKGNDSVIYAGGTQWIHADMGIIHSERVPLDIFDLGGEQELLQVWINSPAANKMDIPSYYPASKEETPTIISADGLVHLLLPAGALEDKQGIIPTFTKVSTIMGTAQKSGQYQFEFGAKENTLLYVLQGSLLVNGQELVQDKQLAIFNHDGTGFTIEAKEDSRFFVGSGVPIQEPIASHGPFVMNTQTEILEAFRDYQQGKMGVLIEEPSTIHS